MKLLKLPYILFLVVLFLQFQNVKAQFYTGSNQPFGKNRVQYNPQFWKRLSFQRFEVLFNGTGKQNAIYAAKVAQKALVDIEGYLDVQSKDKLQILVFNTQAQFRQSNIGLTSEEETNIGGSAKISGNKVFVYYEGDHKKFDQQIREGIIDLMVHKLVYGDQWTESLKNSTLLSLPDWFLKGFVDYKSTPWDAEIDNKVKSGILSGKFEKFNRLEGEDARLAGMAMWNYIAEAYGEKLMPNILYLTRVSRNVESGFMYVLGTSLKNLTSDFLNYYKERYQQDDQARIEPNAEELCVKIKKKYQRYQQFKLSPDGKYAAFVTYELGQYKIWLLDLEENKMKKIHKGDFKLDRIPDYSHPVLAWHPTSTILTFAEEKKGEMLLNIYEIEEKKKYPRTLLRLEKILDMAYSDDGKSIIMSAVYKGQTDLFLYNVIGNNQKQLTDDIFDDLNPRFVDNSKRIIFASNRFEDTIRKENEIKQYSYVKDIFIVQTSNPKLPLIRITNTPHVDESHPAQFQKDQYTYLSDENGVYNRYVAYYDSAVSYIDTTVHYRYFSVIGRLSNYKSGISEYEVNANNDIFSMVQIKNGGYHFYKGKVSDEIIYEDNIEITRFEKYKRLSFGEKIENPNSSNEIVEPLDSGEVDINNYIFDIEQKEDSKDVGNTVEEEVEKIKVVFSEDTTTLVKETFEKEIDLLEFKLPREELYEVNFAIDNIITQLGNSFLNQSYQRYTGSAYQTPGLNNVTKISASDVFEDYHLIGGFRLPFDLNTSEYLLSFENLKTRIDKTYTLTRQAFTQPNGDFTEKVRTYNLGYELKYPFSVVSSLRLSFKVRIDRIATLSTGEQSLAKETVNHYMGGARLAYVYDNTRKLGLNLLQGVRMKIWGESYKEPLEKKSDFFVLGLDFRHYQKIHRQLIFATRLAVSTSVGNQRLLYYLGGVDNWLGQKFDPSIIPDPNQNYQFQTIATPLRGFYQNIRNGNSMAVLNNELRFPAIKYFAAKPIRSDFLENFMIIGFGDVGTAWTGWNPYTSENSFNTTVIYGSNYTISIQNQKEPIVYSYGWGLRSRIFGYYVRFDWAWGVDDGVRLKPLKQFSLSLDF